MKTACFVLRAQPFHLGHLKVIQWILKKHEKIVIVIGSSKQSRTESNPFSFEERKEMIEKTLKSEGINKERYKIIGIPDVHDDKAWVESILKKVKFDLVYTRNPWTEECFSLFKIPVKKHPIFGDLSGSKIRNLLRKGKNWEQYVPKEVKRIIRRVKDKVV